MSKKTRNNQKNGKQQQTKNKKKLKLMTKMIIKVKK